MKVKCYVCQKDMSDTEAAKSFYDSENKRHYLCKDCEPTTVNVQKPKESEEASSIGWVSLIRAVAWLGIIVGMIASIGLGATIIEEESGFLGFLVIIVGILLTLIVNAAIMIFLDMADDIHTIRQKLDKM